MNPTSFIAFVEDLRVKTANLSDAVLALNRLIGRVKVEIDRSDPLSLPLSQAEVDHIIQIQSPIYNAVLTLIETAADALGTDIFH